MLDGEEIIKDKVYHFPASQFDPLNPFSNSVIHIVFSKKSDPLNRDSDDDGLLDGRPEYYNEFSIAPKDPHPMKKDGAYNLWKTHIRQIKESENFSSEYSNDHYEPITLKSEIKFWGIIPYLENAEENKDKFIFDEEDKKLWIIF